MASLTSAHYVKFVSKKIKRVRWQNVQQRGLQKSMVFCSGSWDDTDNTVAIWGVASLDSGSMEFDSVTAVPVGEPELVCQTYHSGDVMDMIFMSEESILTASSTGDVNLFRYHSDLKTLRQHHQWSQVHSFSNSNAACTGLAAVDDDLVITVGEDGAVHILNLKQRTYNKAISKQDNCNLNAVRLLNQKEIATVSATGQLKVWDLRESSTCNAASQSFHLPGERVPLHCVDKHPAQPHILATGGQDGMLCVWDMRQKKYPVTLLDAHSSDLWEVKFHPSHPDNLFSCSEDGEVWHWDGSGKTSVSSATSGTFHSNSVSLLQRNNQGSTIPWLLSDTAKQKLEITSMFSGNIMPVNTLDILDETLVCGTDGEAVYVQHGLILR